MNTKKKNKVVKVMAVALAFCLTMGIAQKTVMATTYTLFPYVFNGGSGVPSSATHITQTVDVTSYATEQVGAECTQYSYTGNMPVLTVKSDMDDFPTTSVSFAGTGTNKMKYTYAIPISGKTVTFKGTVTNYSTYFTIVAKVEG